MAIDMRRKDFHASDMAGIKQKFPARKLDETGNRARPPRVAPGVYATKPFVSGAIVGDDESGAGRGSFAPDTRARRLPGACHGPFRSVDGCVLLDIHCCDTDR